jgi:Fur family ferric uptake transcriptional regulator
MNKKSQKSRNNKDRIRRTTNQRRIILEELRKVKFHPSADEVYEMVRRRIPRISMGTVYRNLEILAQSSEILMLEAGGQQRRYDGNAREHCHVRCLTCGRVSDIDVNPVVSLDRDPGDASDYRITGQRIEFVGFCPRCKRGG